MKLTQFRASFSFSSRFVLLGKDNNAPKKESKRLTEAKEKAIMFIDLRFER